MLNKLLKYEIKATARTFLPLYLVLIVFGIINSIFASPEEFGIPAAISMTLYIVILVGTFITTFIVMIQRFYKNLLNDEGYLMFTLPAETWKHIVSKLLVSMMWTVLSAFLAVVSILTIAMSEISLAEIIWSVNQLFDQAYNIFGSSLYSFVIQMAFGIVLTLTANILMIYVSIAIGHLLNRHRILASIGAYFGIYIIIEILLSFVMKALFGNGIFGTEISYAAAPDFIQMILWFVVIISAILAAIFFLATNLILSKRLNLE